MTLTLRTTCFFLLFTLCALLSGCFNVLFTGASAVYDRHNLQESAKNSGIALNISNIIQSDYEFDNSNIKVSCFNYQVLLTGEATTQALRLKAAKIAANTAGVKHVYNFIEIGPVDSASQDWDDAWITTKIKSAIIAKADMDPDKIKVVTENGVVYLMGFLTRKQANEAVNIARYMPDVKQVVRIFRYVIYK